MTEKEKMIRGLIYNPTDKQLTDERIRARRLADKFNRTDARDLDERTAIIEELFPNGGKNAFFEPNIRIEYGYNVIFGDNFFMNFDCQLLDVAPITIGNDVMFGPRVTVATPCHPLVADERIAHRYKDGFHDWEFSKPVTIGDNVWVASGVTICGGVNIGSNTVIAAGSVVVRDIPDGVLAGGVPCKVIRKITDEDRLFEKNGIEPPINGRVK